MPCPYRRTPHTGTPGPPCLSAGILPPNPEEEGLLPGRTAGRHAEGLKTPAGEETGEKIEYRIQ